MANKSPTIQFWKVLPKASILWSCNWQSPVPEPMRHHGPISMGSYKSMGMIYNPSESEVDYLYGPTMLLE